MPTANVTVPASTTPTEVTVWTCVLCVRTTPLVLEKGTPIEAIEHFIDRLGWRMIASAEVVCDRCKLHPAIAHLLLAEAKVRTQ